jgi:hypothetical protein
MSYQKRILDHTPSLFYLSHHNGKHVLLLLVLDFKCYTMEVMMMMMHFKVAHVWVFE